MSAPTLQSFIAGQWLGQEAAQSLTSAVNGVFQRGDLGRQPSTIGR